MKYIVLALCLVMAGTLFASYRQMRRANRRGGRLGKFLKINKGLS